MVARGGGGGKEGLLFNDYKYTSVVQNENILEMWKERQGAKTEPVVLIHSVDDEWDVPCEEKNT